MLVASLGGAMFDSEGMPLFNKGYHSKQDIDFGHNKVIQIVNKKTKIITGSITCQLRNLFGGAPEDEDYQNFLEINSDTIPDDFHAQ